VTVRFWLRFQPVDAIEILILKGHQSADEFNAILDSLIATNFEASSTLLGNALKSPPGASTTGADFQLK